MADVRAMLRSELASRKADQQQASKKRKAAPEIIQPESKKARSEAAQPNAAPDTPTDSPTKALPTRESPVSEAEAVDSNLIDNGTTSAQVEIPATSQMPTAEEVDEDEWAAFERDVASPPPLAEGEAAGQSGLSVFNAPATITAQPLSAEEIAAQAREQESTQARGKRDVELEEEKEEAQQALQDEFEEMEGLEERVRRLREKREAIRRASDSRPNADGAEHASTGLHGQARLEAVREDGQDGGSDTAENDSDDNEEDDGWSLWRR